MSRRLLRQSGLVLAAVGAAIVFFLLGIGFRILMGPVSLGPFNAELRDALRQQLPGLRLNFDEAALAWSPDEARINLVIFGTRVFDRNERIIAQAPQAEIGLAAGPLVSGRIVVTRIALVGVQLTLVHTKSGALRLGTERDRSQSDILKEISDAIARSRSNGVRSLNSFAVHRARLAFFDEATGAFVVAPEAEVQVADGAGEGTRSSVAATVDAHLEISGKPAHLLARIVSPRDGDGFTGDFSIANLDLRSLAANATSFAGLKPFAMTADASGSFTVVHGTVLRYLDIGIGASGTVNDIGPPLHLKSVRLVVRYDGQTGRVLVDDGSVDGDRINAHFTGATTLGFDSAGSLIAADYTFQVDKLAASMRNVLPQSVNLASAFLKGSYQAAAHALVFDQAAISGGPLSAKMAGKVLFSEGKSPAIDVDGKIDPISIRDLLRFWPFNVGAGARDWIQSNVSAGRIGPVMIHTNITAGALDQAALSEGALAVSFPINNATISYLHGLTPLTNVSGLAQLSGDTFKADVTSASLGPLSVGNGHVAIPNLHMHGMIGAIKAHVEGSLPNVLALADMKPLHYPSQFHINPLETKGSAALDLAFRIPMVKSISVNNIGISIKANVAGLSLALGPHTKIANGTVNFDVDNKSLHATGQLGFGTTNLAVDWLESFKPAPVTSHVQVRGTLDDAARTAFNLHTEQILSGPVNVVANLEGYRGTIQKALIEADLTPASLVVDLVNMRKGAGSAANASVSARLGPDGNFRSADISVSGNALSAKGSVTFGDTGNLQGLALSSVRDGGLNDFALSMSDTPANGLNLAISGRSADGTALGHKTSSQGKSGKETTQESSEPFHVSAKLDRLVLRDGMSLAPFALDVSGTGQHPRTMALTAMLSKSAQISANITSSESGRKFSLSSNDAGLLLKGLFGFTSIKSGQLNVSAAMPPVNAPGAKSTPDYVGQLTIKDCTVVNQAFLTRLFSSGSLEGFVDLMRGQGVAIDTLQVPFQVDGDVIDVHDARASGPSIGITTDGYIDRANNQIALQGAIAPLYGLNGVLGSIPVLGNVLVSKQGEGVFGVTYRASGNADEPQVIVNPLAMLTPGIFRRIFEGSAPSAPPAQANSANPPARPQ